MSDVNGVTPPPGYMAMMGDTLGPLGMLGAGRAAYGAGKLAVSKIPGLLARYGSSALGSLARAPMTGAMTGLYAMGDGHGNLTTAMGDEPPQYIQGENGWQPNTKATATLGVSPADQALLKQAAPAGMTPAGATPPPTPMQAAMAPGVGGIGSDHSSTPWQTAAAPAPDALPPQAALAGPASASAPAPGPTTPPPNFYNGPGSQNFGQPVAPGAAGGIPNGANITSALQQLFSGQGGSMFQPQAPAAQQSNPMGNILPFIKNLLSGGSSGGGGE